MGFECWLDQTAETITKDSMAAGVKHSKIFLLFLSQGVLSRPFCLFEIQTALALQKKIMLMHETDDRHHAFDFSADEVQQAPADVSEIFMTHESLPFRRRRFEQDAILAELIRTSGIDAGLRVEHGKDGNRDQGSAAASQLAAIPSEVPPLLESYSPRTLEETKVLSALLNRDAPASPKVLAHGMGGMGKTSLACYMVRKDEVRAHFERIGFVSVGQEPASLMELQRSLHIQLLGEPLVSKDGATVQSQWLVLQQAAVGCKWLVVLDDIWAAGHEHSLNFVDAGQSPESRVFVTTRFTSMLPGYLEVALGFLDEANAVKLLLETAERKETGSGVVAAKQIVKLCGGS